MSEMDSLGLCRAVLACWEGTDPLLVWLILAHTCLARLGGLPHYRVVKAAVLRCGVVPDKVLRL